MKNKGFTLIEILISIGIMVILLTLVIGAINPMRQFAQVRNTQRWAHINSILSATYQNTVDHGGTFTCAAGPLPTSTTLMATGGYDICGCLVPTYLESMPYDPTPTVGSYTNCTTYNTGYKIMQNATTTRLTITAPSAELGETISVAR